MPKVGTGKNVVEFDYTPEGVAMGRSQYFYGGKVDKMYKEGGKVKKGKKGKKGY